MQLFCSKKWYFLRKNSYFCKDYRSPKRRRSNLLNIQKANQLLVFLRLQQRQYHLIGFVYH